MTMLKQSGERAQADEYLRSRTELRRYTQPIVRGSAQDRRLFPMRLAMPACGCLLWGVRDDIGTGYRSSCMIHSGLQDRVASDHS
jgi:hypothetical protein